ISAEPNKKFHVSGSFNIVQLSNAKIQLYVDFYNSTMFTGASVTEISEVTQGGYVTLANNGIIPANTTNARVYALIRGTADNGSGVFLVDGISFNYGEPNLIYNSSFETVLGNSGRASNWVESKWGANGSYEVSPISSSEHAQKIIGSGIVANGAIGVRQVISVEPNKKFHISGSFNITQLSNAKVQLYVDFYNSTMFTGASVTEIGEVTQGGYVTLANNGIIPANTT
ncbi:hypothetical protein, partial [Paenibacillus periandrae]|uniref:hypothetical protein n=1 Tax=Paenibacillus periandrae TaxID=1761741 RepID=UPI001F099C39